MSKGNDNLAVYCDDEVVSHYARASDLLPPERHLFARYLRPGMAVLDIGVGGGRTSPFLSAGASRYLGVDYAPGMVDACRVRFPELDFAVGDASDLNGIADEEFDLTVFSFNGIDTLPDDAARRRALGEMRRVTRPDGHIILSSHSARQLVLLPVLEGASAVQKAWRIVRAVGLSIPRAAKALMRPSFWQGQGYIHDPVHGGLAMHVSSPASITADCAAMGLEVIETAGAFHPRRVPEWANNWTTYVLRRSR